MPTKAGQERIIWAELIDSYINSHVQEGKKVANLSEQLSANMSPMLAINQRNY